MAGMQFEYDEKGGTFYYFLLSFLALILLPVTFYLWPREDSKDDESKNKKACHCEPCQMKKQLLKAHKPWTSFKRRALKLLLILCWLAFFAVVYKASQVELDWTEFDPYAELGIDRGATDREIKKAYHKLSLVLHPDRGGDPQKFMRITKAYQALTDEEARKNWEEYGNPDGPGATHFGIALPKWIVEKQNSVWVLAVYGLVFMVILPVVVGTWWYRSIKYSAEQILMDTTQLYYYFFHKTPNMILKRVVMILAASFEFDKMHNAEVVERPSDNEELPMLMRDLPHLMEKNKERPLCHPYSVKARALIHAHYSRLELPPKTLEQDRQYVLKKCPYLINEMINIIAQLVALAHAGRVSKTPRLDTVENCMKVSQMTVQALWDNKSPLLQLPHINEDMQRHFVTKRRNIRSIKQFVLMKDEDRKALLRSLSNEEYRDVMNVCSAMPDVNMEVSSKVLDDEDTTITAGSIVTVTVRLIRQSMEALFSNDGRIEELENNGEEEKLEEEEEQQDEEIQNSESPVRKPKVWEKQQKKKKNKGGKPKKKPAKVPAKKAPATITPVATHTVKESGDASPLPNGQIKPRKEKKPEPDDVSTDEDLSDVEQESDEEDIGDIVKDQHAQEVDDEDEDDWVKFQEESKKENVLETKSKETHTVHCPYFPAVKHEWWWVYVADRKHHLLITAPVQVCSLKQEEEIQLKFSAPVKPGTYQYTVILRSDSYLDFDQNRNIKLDVKEAKLVKDHPQWDISDEEDKDADEEGTESEGYSDDEDSEE